MKRLKPALTAVALLSSALVAGFFLLHLNGSIATPIR